MSFAIEVPGAAIPLNASDLCKALQAGNSSDHSQRQAASQQLDEWQTHQNYFSLLQTVFIDKSLSYEVRFLAIILLKNGIDKFWRSSVRSHARLPAEEKALIRSRLLQGTVDEENRTLALHNALATSKIVRIDYPQEWPEAVPDIIAVLRQVKDTSPARLRGALLVLLRVIKELGSARLRKSQTALQHVAEELSFLMAEIYTANTTAWMEYLTSGNDASSAAPAMEYATENSLLSLKVLRHLITSGFEYPHRSKLVQDFWSISQTHFDQFLSYINSQTGSDTANGGNGGGAATEMVGKHLLKLAKIHLDMSNTHPASFAALPNSVPLVRGYWGLVANFAEVYLSSGGLRQNSSGGGDGGESKSDKVEGPLIERLALRGLLLIKSCIQIISQPLQTFKYRSPEAQKEQNEGVARIKAELFTDEFVLQVVHTIITKLFRFRESDLEAWEEDPEDWEMLQSESGQAWEWQVRPCAERVFLSLLINYKALLGEPMLSYFQQAMSDSTDLLTKEAVYTAMSNAAAAIDQAFDYGAFLESTLVKDVQFNGHLAKILRRRIAILMGSWAFYELSQERRVMVYQMYAHLLNKDDAANDEVVRLTAVRSLKSTIDDYQFRAADFEPYAGAVFVSLLDLLQSVENDETKFSVLDTIRLFIQRLETIASQFSDGVMNALPGIWASEAADVYMIKQSVLSILSTLIMALGSASQKYHEVTYPLISDAMNPNSSVHQFLFEEATDLWYSVLCQAATPLAGALTNMLPLVLNMLTYDSNTVQTSLNITGAYIVLSPESVLSDDYRRQTLDALANVMESKKWELVKDAATNIQKLITAAHQLGGAPGLSMVVRDLLDIGFVPRILERLHGVWEAHQSTGPNAKPVKLKPTTQVEYVLILSRIALADPGTFVDMLASLAGADSLPSAWSWLSSEWFGTFDNMGNPEYHKVACMALTRLCELGPDRHNFQELVLGQLQDFFTMWTSSVLDAQGHSTKPDYFLWAEGPPAPTEYDTPLMTAESVFAGQDPLHTEILYDFIKLRLQDLVARAGGEAAFEANWAVNVDREVLAGFRALTEPIPADVEE